MARPSLPDGRLLVTDTKRGLIVLSKDGLVQGELSPTEIDELGLTQRSRIIVRGDDVYVETGRRFSSTQYVTKLSLAAILDRATHGESANDRGWGLARV